MITGKRKIFVLLLIGVSALGVLAFFPLQMSDNHCCAFQKLVADTAKNSACCADCPNHAVAKMAGNHSPIVHDYISSYAVPWWLSIGGLFIGITIFRKAAKVNIKQSKQEKTS